MIKLFNGVKTKSLPFQGKPNHDLIAKLEKELKPQGDGFDERYDQMLIDEFTSSNPGTNLPFTERIAALHDLMESMYSDRYKLMVVNLINEARMVRWKSNDLDYDALKARMMSGGQWRKS